MPAPPYPYPYPPMYGREKTLCVWCATNVDNGEKICYPPTNKCQCVVCKSKREKTEKQ